jgi:hypothetical protein
MSQQKKQKRTRKAPATRKEVAAAMTGAPGPKFEKQTQKSQLAPVMEVARNLKVTKSGKTGRKPNARILKYLRDLENPFDAEHPVSLVSHNVAPSIGMLTYKSTANMTTVVGTASSSQVTIFPGHTVTSAAALDAQSNHSNQQAVHNGSIVINHPVGPCSMAGVPAIAGAVQGSLGIDASTYDTSAVGNLPIIWDVNCPFAASATDSGHLRWQLVCMGVRVTTGGPLAERSIEVISVQPDNLAAYAAQADYSRFGTWRRSTLSNIGTEEIVWLPKPMDQAYWHADSGNTSSTTNAGILMWLRNPNTTKSQTCYISIVAHWMIAGQSVEMLTRPDINMPGDNDVIGPAIVTARYHPAFRGVPPPLVSIGKTIAGYAAPTTDGDGVPPPRSSRSPTDPIHSSLYEAASMAVKALAVKTAAQIAKVV